MENPYVQIAQKVKEQDPHTAPTDENGNIHKAFIEHLKIHYTQEEAQIMKHLNCFPFFMPLDQLADITGRDPEHLKKMLQKIKKRLSVVEMDEKYCLPHIQTFVNAHSISPDKTPEDIKAAHLYQEYFIKGGFYKYYESTKKGTPLARIIPVGKTIGVEQKVMDAEEAHDYILNHTTDEMALVPCPCRTRTEKLDIRECSDKFPIASCIMLGVGTEIFKETGLSKQVTKQEAIEYFDQMQELGLVGQTLNASYGDMVICLCCGCCCSHLRGRTRWDNPHALSPSNFIPRSGEDCINCGLCEQRCPVDAISMDEGNDAIKVEIDQCIGCGVCALTCPQKTLKLIRHERAIPPFTSTQELMEVAMRENRE